MKEIWYIARYDSMLVKVWLFTDNDEIEEFDKEIFVKRERLYEVLNYLDCKYNIENGICPVFEMG